MEPSKALRQTDRSRLTTLPRKGDQLHSAHGRSKSVPPDLSASPTRQIGRVYKEYEDVESEDDSEVEESMRAGRWETQLFPHVEEFGPTSTYVGTLSTGQDDGSLVLSIDGRRIDFQLSLVSFEEIKDGDDMGQLFNQYLVNYDRLLDDESVVQDPRLVMRWGGNQYVTSFLPLNLY
jgi:phosphatidate phosphatase LPIN